MGKSWGLMEISWGIMGSHGESWEKLSIMLLTILSTEVLDDVRGAAWLEAELHPELDRHRRHEMADICEPGNIERVWRVLAMADAQVRIALIRILTGQNDMLLVNDLQQPPAWHYRFLFPIPTNVMSFLREKIHEYMVAAVMADRTDVIIPSAASIWRSRLEDALAQLQNLGATTRPPYGRVRRPLWPL